MYVPIKRVIVWSSGFWVIDKFQCREMNAATIVCVTSYCFNNLYNHHLRYLSLVRHQSVIILPLLISYFFSIQNNLLNNFSLTNNSQQTFWYNCPARNNNSLHLLKLMQKSIKPNFYPPFPLNGGTFFFAPSKTLDNGDGY